MNPMKDFKASLVTLEADHRKGPATETEWLELMRRMETWEDPDIPAHFADLRNGGNIPKQSEWRPSVAVWLVVFTGAAIWACLFAWVLL